MKRKIIVLYAKPYCVTDEKTGEINEGISVSYYSGETLEPLKCDGSVGKRPSKASLPLELLDKVSVAPAMYEGHFDFDVDSKGKEVLKMLDLNFVSEISVVSKQQTK